MGNNTTQAVEHLTPAELDALLEAARAATPGPWGVFPSNQGNLARIETQKGTTAEQGQCFTVCAIPKTRISDAEYIATANPATIERLVLMVRELQRDCLRGICVYCGYIEQYESLEQKNGPDGNQMRIDHIQQCLARPELKLINELKQAWAEIERLKSLPLVETEGE